MRTYSLLLLLLLCNTLAVGQTKRALVIGLGRQEDSSWSKVHGDNDADLVAQSLAASGFAEIRILKNEQATKQGIVTALGGMINRCQKGDWVYVHYSGHGQLMTDLDGDEALRWTGRHAQWDESWIPYDAYMTYGQKDKGEKHLCDDEVGMYLSKIRQKVGSGGRIYVVIDACHSGDASRGEDEECVRGVDVPFVIPRQPVEVQPTLLKEQWLTISACLPYQLCFEQKNPTAGKLTYALCLLGSRLFEMTRGEITAWVDGYFEAYPSRLQQNPLITGNF